MARYTSLLLTGLLTILATAHASAQTVTVSLSAADSVAQGELMYLTFAFEDLEVGHFELPELVGLTIVAGPSTRSQMSIVNGVRSSSRAFVYRVQATQSGLAFVPEVEVEHEGDTVTSDAISLYVSENPDFVPAADHHRDLPAEPTPPRPPKRPTVRM